MEASKFPNLEEMVANLPCYVYWLDLNQVYLGCNNLVAILFGLASKQDIVGKKLSDLISHPTIIEILNKNWYN